MPANQFLPIANGVGANALTPAQWAASGALLASGFQAGVVPSIQFNTFLRQFSVPVSAIAQFVADNQTADVLDDGVVANFESKFGAALTNFATSLIKANTLTVPTAAVTIYVAPSGNDTNPGTSASPFLTIQAAINKVIKTYAPSIYPITIQLADGTYGGATLNAGSNLNLIINGNNTTPSNVIVSGSTGPNVTAGCGFYVGAGLSLTVTNLRVTTSTANGYGLYAFTNSAIYFAGVDFGVHPTTGAHIRTSGGYVQCVGNYTISGTAGTHLSSSDGGRIFTVGFSCTITAAIGFNTFAQAVLFGYIAANAMTYVNPGNVTAGVRYSAGPICVIYVAGAGVNYFPGATAGTTNALGFYG